MLYANGGQSLSILGTFLFPEFHTGVLKQKDFRDRLAAVAVVELDLVDHWVKFHSRYNQLQVLRTRLPCVA